MSTAQNGKESTGTPITDAEEERILALGYDMGSGAGLESMVDLCRRMEQEINWLRLTSKRNREL